MQSIMTPKGADSRLHSLCNSCRSFEVPAATKSATRLLGGRPEITCKLVKRLAGGDDLNLRRFGAFELPETLMICSNRESFLHS